MDIDYRLQDQNEAEQEKQAVYARGVTKELQVIAQLLTDEVPGQIAGFAKDGTMHLLMPDDIIRVFIEGGIVMAQTAEGTYELRQRLLEAMERLSAHGFVRVSRTELINLRRAKWLDMSFNGIIMMQMESGVRVRITKQCLKNIKRRLGV